ncbi:MAG: hypothetical protein CL916_09680 [Deltaproteobacteria bacterium]|nr:hypothetical protein [Deltaproteobacteria bacterium]
MPCIQIQIDADDFTELGSQNRFGGSHEDQLGNAIGHILSTCTEPFPDPFSYFPADIQVDGISADTVGIRKKGFVGSVLSGSDQRPSLKVKTNKFVDNQYLGEIERLTLNNNLTDPSRMRTCLVYSVFHDAGYPAPLCNLANVMVNDVSLGAYTHVEPIKKSFLRRAFGNDHGSLYESTVADFTQAHLDNGLGRWEAKTDETIADPTLLLEIVTALTSSDEMLEETLETVLDIDLFLSFWALETIVAHGDGYNANSNNSYVYFDPDNNARAVFIPWGPDDAMRESEEMRFVQSALANRLSRHSILHSMYLERLTELLDTVWSEENLYDRIDILQAHVHSAEAYQDFELEIGELRLWITDRRNTIQQLIDTGGDIGEEPDDGCVPGMNTEELLETGEVVGTASVSCSTQKSPSHPVTLVFIVIGLRIMRSKRQH